MLNQTLSKLSFLVLCIAGIYLSSCEYEFIEPEQVIIPEVISFSDDVQPIFDRSCNGSGCHVNGFGVLDLSIANAYEDLFRRNLINLEMPEESGLYLKLIDASGTHQGRSSPTDQGIILEWIKDGAKNN